MAFDLIFMMLSFLQSTFQRVIRILVLPSTQIASIRWKRSEARKTQIGRKAGFSKSKTRLNSGQQPRLQFHFALVTSHGAPQSPNELRAQLVKQRVAELWSLTTCRSQSMQVGRDTNAPLMERKLYVPSSEAIQNFKFGRSTWTFKLLTLVFPCSRSVFLILVPHIILKQW